jgi:hypothetical protein
VLPPAILTPPPVAVPVTAQPAGAALDFTSQPDLLVSSPRLRPAKKRRLRLGPVLAILGVVVLGVVVGVWLLLWRMHFARQGRGEDEPVRTASLFNARFDWPARPWQRATDIEFKLHVNLGMRVPDRNNCMGLYFKDYKTRMPGEAEMTDEALGKLRSYFQGLEWELKKDERADLAGRPALLVEFQGEDPEHVPMNGECYIMAYRGYAYWFFTWGPLADKEIVRPHWPDLRDRFHLLDGRKGWSESPRETEKVQGKKGNYQLSYVKGLWMRKTAQDYDPKADLVLRGDEPDPERKKLASKTATFQVLLLPRQDDLKAAVAAAREYLQKREEGEYPKTTMTPIMDKKGAPLDRDTQIGGQRGHLSKLHVQNTEDLERFFTVAVFNRPEGVLVLVGDCLWERRDFWEQEFAPLVDSLRVR